MHAPRPRTVLTLALLAVLASAGAVGAQVAAKKGTLVSLRKTALGKVLVDARGRTLYLYTPDGRNRSTCDGACASAWPPLLTTGRPRAGRGLRSKLLGETMRRDGTRQVTYAGHPLYRFAADAKAGETTGEGVGGIWYAVSAQGKKVAPKQSATSAPAQTTTATTTTTKSNGGYGSGY
jgi:predicted lipoprotein with Yx(FWY)xxD motif